LDPRKHRPAVSYDLQEGSTRRLLARYAQRLAKGTRYDNLLARIKRESNGSGAAMTAIAKNDYMSGLLKDCVAFGGDIDTVAAIAMAVGSCSEEIEQDLPPHLFERLENGAYGRDYLARLDSQLMGIVL
jgi:hypothetical protein